MKINAKTDYACRAMLELALHWPDRTPVRISEIAENQHIPMKFLPHILIQLKDQGYVESIRGKRGGYVLSMAPKNIKLRDIFGDHAEVAVRPEKDSVFTAIWQEMDSAVMHFLDSITFEDIIRRHRSHETVLVYAI